MASEVDGISYHMIANMRPGAEQLFLNLINQTWDQRERPRVWNDHDF